MQPQHPRASRRGKPRCRRPAAACVPKTVFEIDKDSKAHNEEADALNIRHCFVSASSILRHIYTTTFGVGSNPVPARQTSPALTLIHRQGPPPWVMCGHLARHTTDRPNSTPPSHVTPPPMSPTELLTRRVRRHPGSSSRAGRRTGALSRGA